MTDQFLFVSFTLRDLSGGGEGRLTFRADAQTGDLFDALPELEAVGAEVIKTNAHYLHCERRIR